MSPVWSALRALRRNPMRSFLTALGVIVGVGCVIAMTSIGAGARARVEETFAAMGSNMLIVRSGSAQAGGARGGAGTEPSLTWADLAAIRDEVPELALVAAQLTAAAQVQAEGQNWATSVQGTTPELFAIRNWTAGAGRLFDAGDVEGASKVIVLGQTVVENLFGAFTDPVGRVVRVNRVPFEVVGVLAEKGQSAFGSDNDDVAFVPLSTFRSRVETGELGQFVEGTIFASARSPEGAALAKTRIEDLLRARHRIRKGALDDFTVRNLGDFVAAQEEGARTMNLLLSGIALVSLVVGGIGIMNIMLVSVTERTREIGLRMAVGARPRSILVQFLVEAIVLSGAGGLAGLAAGLGTAAWLVSRFDWPMLVHPAVTALALAGSALVGVVFGLYPAWKASRLDPIQALRFE
ncbi:MAG: ABC transporter permease [Deltaproteobacteria bacterium]|nr:ABC transporter permease [Deltaproteobacteria bacterium]